ncbi:antirestriction protein, partial [Sinorhizobium medicae]
GHWTGAKHRLDRDLTGRFGSASYAADELVAELAASFLCADLGVDHDPRDNTAAYVASWLAVLKNDKRAIITATAKAQSAADYLHGLQLTKNDRLHVPSGPQMDQAGSAFLNQV